METTTEPRMRTLRRICTLGRVAGWAMIAMGLLGIVSIAALIRQRLYLFIVPVYTHGLVYNAVQSVGEILTGLVILGTVQFIRYATEESAEPRWLLRNGHVFLYLFAIFLFVTAGLQNWPVTWNGVTDMLALTPDRTFPMGRALGVAMFALFALVQVIPKALCVLGLAVILRMMLPIVAESKTLA